MTLWDCQGSSELPVALLRGTVPPSTALEEGESVQRHFAAPTGVKTVIPPLVEIILNRCLLSDLPLKRQNEIERERKQHCAVDHLARGSMKNAANCVSECELQDT